MTNKKTKVEELVEFYGFSTGSLKWVPEGGDLLKYIGQTVVLVNFEKDDTGNWTSKYEPAVIDRISDYNPADMTYKVTYKVGDSEVKEIRIIPEGFSKDIASAEMSATMKRFIPQSLHASCVEEEQFYTRLREEWNDMKTMKVEGLLEITKNKDKERILRYCRNVCVVAKTPADDMLYFRLSNIKIRQVKCGRYEVTLVDGSKREYVVYISREEKEDKLEWKCCGELVGDLVIIDLGV
jgi:hypothetical protein